MSEPMLRPTPKRRRGGKIRAWLPFESHRRGGDPFAEQVRAVKRLALLALTLTGCGAAACPPPPLDTAPVAPQVVGVCDSGIEAYIARRDHFTVYCLDGSKVRVPR